jgi:hypothetical protein
MLTADEVLDGQWRLRCTAGISRARHRAPHAHPTLEFGWAVAAVLPLSRADASKEAVPKDISTQPY